MRILFGTDRTALRQRALTEISQLSLAWPDQRVILIVPEQTKVDMERDYLAMSGQSGLMMAEILSFRRLAWRLMSEVGLQPRRTIDSVGQGMLIHAILKENKSRLHTFGHLADKPGFINQAAAALGDLRRCRVSFDQLSEMAASADDKALHDKMSDFAVLLSGYQKALVDIGMCDAEDDLARLGDILHDLARLPANAWPWPQNRLSWLRRTQVWISGFAELRDFTPQEDQIIEALNQLCSRLTLTLAADSLPFDRQAADAGPNCFFIGRKAAWRLLRQYPESRTEKVTLSLTGTAAAVASGISRDGPLISPGDNSWLKLIRTESLDDELAWTAGEIRRLVQEDGFRYQDISLAVCDLPVFSSRLKAVFREYGVPLFLDAERPVSGTPLIRFVLSFLDLGIHNWPLSAIMTCLRSGVSALEPAEIDCLENEFLARGINRPDRIFDDSRYSSVELLAFRDKALLPWREALAHLRQADTCEEKCRRLHRFLDMQLLPRLKNRSVILTADGELDVAVVQVQSWNELLRVIRQMTDLAGQSIMSLATFRDLLAAGLQTAGASVIPTAIDQVSVGDLQHSILRRPRILFIIGASADLLPPKLPPEGLLKDQDRQAISGLIGMQMPSSARDQVFTDAFMLYTLLTLPENHLYLSAHNDEVSSWFTWLSNGAPGRLVTVASRPDWHDPRLNSLRPAFSYLINQSSCQLIAEKGWLAIGQTLKSAGLPLEAAAEWLRRGALFDQRRNVHISPLLIQQLFGDHPVMSVSQLEKYAACPYSHLATYLLALKERELWEPEAVETGTLLHGVIEMALTDLCADLNGTDPSDPCGWQAAIDCWLEAGIENRIDGWLRAAVEREGLQVFFDKGISASSGRRVSRQASSSLTAILRQYRHSDFKPAYLEWTFGPTEKNQLSLLLGNGQIMSLRGKIDRVDIREAGQDRHFRVIDYKSGDKKVEYDAICHGLALQLPVYLEAFARNHPGCLPEEAAYFRLFRPFLSLPAGARPAAEEILAAQEKSFDLRSLKLDSTELDLLRLHVMKKAAELTGRIFKGDFAVMPARLPGRLPACAYCPLKALCGFDDNPASFCWLAALRGKKRQALIDCIRDTGRQDGRTKPCS